MCNCHRNKDESQGRKFRRLSRFIYVGSIDLAGRLGPHSGTHRTKRPQVRAAYLRGSGQLIETGRHARLRRRVPASADCDDGLERVILRLHQEFTANCSLNAPAFCVPEAAALHFHGGHRFVLRTVVVAHASGPNFRRIGFKGVDVCHPPGKVWLEVAARRCASLLGGD